MATPIPRIISMQAAAERGLIPSYDPTNRLDARIDAAMVLPYLERLSPRRAEVIRMLYLECRTYAEIARHFDVSCVRVEQIRDDALRAMRIMLKKDGI